MAVIAEQIAAALMHEQKLVAVRVACELAHRSGQRPVSETERCVAENTRRGPRIGAVRRSKLRQVERARTQRSLPRCPARGRMAVIHLRRGAVEAFFSELALKCALGQVG